MLDAVEISGKKASVILNAVKDPFNAYRIAIMICHRMQLLHVALHTPLFNRFFYIHGNDK